MRRDVGLLRKMMLEIEEKVPLMYPGDSGITGYGDDILVAHTELLLDCRWVSGFSITGMGGTHSVQIRGLNNSGHDFLDLARSDDRWKQIEPMLGSYSVEMVVAQLEAIAQKDIAFLQRESDD